MTAAGTRDALPVVRDWFAHEDVTDDPGRVCLYPAGSRASASRLAALRSLEGASNYNFAPAPCQTGRGDPLADRRGIGRRDLVRVYEPHAHPFVRGNIWWLRGADRDLVVDSGLGVARLRTCVPAMFEHDPLLVLTHTHLDHAGSAHEFGDVAVHAAEPLDVGGSLDGATLAAQLGIDADLTGSLIDAVPVQGYDPSAYVVRDFAVTQALADHDRIDIGGRVLTVVHLPGHTPGSIGLLDEHEGTFFSGDVVYDDVLLDTIDGADPEAYRESMRRIRDLPVRVVRPGHDASFGPERLHQLVDSYLAGGSA